MFHLVNIQLDANVKAIGNRTFFGCTSLRKITIPSSVQHIGQIAFGECDGLISVQFDFMPYWFVTPTQNAQSGTHMAVRNSALNAMNLTDFYVQYYWKRN